MSLEAAPGGPAGVAPAAGATAAPVPRPGRPRAALIAVTAPLAAVLGALAVLMPTGFAIRAPGPTEDTLGSQTIGGREVPLVEITGAPVHPASGELLLTTVSVSGGPIGAVMPMDVLFSWAAPSRSVLPVEAVFRPGISRQEQQQQSAAQMTTSQEAATAAALTEVGFDIPTTMTVAGLPDDSAAEGYLFEGDVLQAINGEVLTSFAQLVGLLSGMTPGDYVDLTVLRDDSAAQVRFRTGGAYNDDGSERAALGVFLRSNFDFPIEVAIQIENIGGPSAGMVFALAIVDQLVEEDLLNGLAVAGTGAISADGEVQAVGGVKQKMFGALRDGANWFLVPVANCDDVAGAVPRGLNVVAVSDLAQARAAITAIGAGNTAGLQACAGA